MNHAKTHPAAKHANVLAVAAFCLVVGFGSSCFAQMGGIISQGRVYLGQTPHTYATVLDASSPMGYYVRVWLDGQSVMSLWPTERQGNLVTAYYHVYGTMGQHWTLRGGADRTRYWTPRTAGMMQLDFGPIPQNLFPIVNAPVSGRGRQTYRGHRGAGTKWYPVRANWWGVRFVPTGVFPAAFAQWQQLVQAINRLRNQPKPKKNLTNVTVNRSPVTLRLWDHGKQDGDIVQVFVDGRFYKQIRLTKGGITLSLPLTYGQHRFEVRAMNEGTDKPNTASMSIGGVTQGQARQSWSLKTGQTAGMTINVVRP